MFTEAWRLERDYFYDRGMHGVDWPAMRRKYQPLVDRVTDRAELSDVFAQMVAELSALHIFVRGGDLRDAGDDAYGIAGGGDVRDDKAGGFRITHVIVTDPDRPDRRVPLARPGVDVTEGDVIQSVNGAAALTARDLPALLRGQAGKQVLLTITPKGGGPARDVIVEPITAQAEDGLRYDEWEYTRRITVEKSSQNRIGYVHLRAMGAGNMAEWMREFYPVFDRPGLVIDVRHNNGGNIDSWILGRLLRRAWFYWQPRVGHPTWNMQFAFRGHMVVLVDENTASGARRSRKGSAVLASARSWARGPGAVRSG
jgi:tricorn protease